MKAEKDISRKNVEIIHHYHICTIRNVKESTSGKRKIMSTGGLYINKRMKRNRNSKY